MRNYRQFWGQAIKAGTEKLKENEHKGGLSLNIFSAYNLLKEEVQEVKEEIKTLRCDDFRRIEDIHLGKLRHEFADVMNFAAMGVVECDRLIEERGREYPLGEKFNLRDDI